jgi:hypothetical protein
VSRASHDLADEIHLLVAEALVEQIKAWKEHRLVDADKEGNLVRVFPPALLAQAIKFLKDNGIDAPAQKGNRIDTLKDAMPDFDALESNVVAIRR